MKHLKTTTAILLFSLVGFSAIAQNRPTTEDRAKVREEKRKQIEAQKQPAKKEQQTGLEKRSHLESKKSKSDILLTEKQRKAIAEGKSFEEMRDAKLKKIELSNKEKEQSKTSLSSKKGKYLLSEEEKIAEMKPEEKKKYLLDKVENGNLTDEQKLAIKIELAQLDGKDISNMFKQSNDAVSQEEMLLKQRKLKDKITSSNKESKTENITDLLPPTLKYKSAKDKMTYFSNDASLMKELESLTDWENMSEDDKAKHAEKLYISRAMRNKQN